MLLSVKKADVTNCLIVHFFDVDDKRIYMEALGFKDIMNRL